MVTLLEAQPSSVRSKKIENEKLYLLTKNRRLILFERVKGREQEDNFIQGRIQRE